MKSIKDMGNMELVLSRKLQERRIFPAIDLLKSGTRRDDLLLDSKEIEAMNIVRRGFNSTKSDQVVDDILKLFKSTKDNKELIKYIAK